MKSCIVFSVDDKFLVPFQVSLYSLVKHNPWVKEISFFLIYDNSTLSKENRNILEKNVFSNYEMKFKLIDCAKYIPNNIDLFNFQHVSKAAFNRLFITELINDSYELACYLDSDIIVTGDISDLLIYKEGFPIFAVSNYAASEEIRLFGNAGGNYFNSGVLVCNLHAIRKSDYFTKYINIIIDQAELLLCWDQDVLNLAHQNEWGQLPWFYNVTRHMLASFKIINNNFYRKLDANNIRIIHFDGPSKPWELKSDRDFAKIWREYYYELFNKKHSSSSLFADVLRFFIRVKTAAGRFKRDVF